MRGTYTKSGVDVQEGQLKVIAYPDGILKEGFGKEPENLWGTLETLEADEATVNKST
jgi:hypothetical protein